MVSDPDGRNGSTQFTEQLSFKETKLVAAKLQEIATSHGSDISAMIREAIRFWPPFRERLTDTERQMLHISG